ncbi:MULTISPECIES: S8 family peptidase [Roseomonadaceae]|uniref:S8 family peptidase n=1 Tax=Falsiroseomonas oleicola TaxID=2801474 RepID=A0ABS6HCA7_9PROT|nr:S8 family peptidase [Roseomonas oleicola]MBU8546362.1 S8 family peptidase [Roseomonas oleicola]
MLDTANAAFDRIPPEARPDDEVVGAVTLNPEYIAKSYYPHGLLKAVGLAAIGSKPLIIKPEKKSKDREPEEALTTQLFVMGKRAAFRNWGSLLPLWSEGMEEAADLVSIEEISAPTPSEKIKGKMPRKGIITYEVVLHTDELLGEVKALPQFREYLQKIGVDATLSRRFYAGGLCFLELSAPAEKAREIATYASVRVLRQMPRLRMLRPMVRAGSIPAQPIVVPAVAAMDTSIRAAIFDGGIPHGHPLTRWATPIETAGLIAPTNDELEHGVAVTSAFLFGHLSSLSGLPTPYCKVDHYRVIDSAPGQDGTELFEVLERIQSVLNQEKYDLVNLSLGPYLSVEDDEVHAWTAVLDEFLADGEMLATIAVGNNGASDASLKLNRIQVPSDCVNALAVGAADSPENPWQRAPYSSVGPGRSPGVVKPDLVEFGGSLQRPFLVFSPASSPTVTTTGGTSFSSPSVLRMAAGVRAHFGPHLDTLAIRALLVHCAERGEYPASEIGRGRVARTLDDLVVCSDDTMRVVYRGAITPAKYIRAPVPLPLGDLPGKIQLSATVCYTTAVDPNHPGNYTRAGLEVTFRPDMTKRKTASQIHPDSKSFFGKAQKGLTEDELRRDAWKWENCLHGSIGFLGSSLNQPCFDIHYNSRMEGHDHKSTVKLRYAMIITIKAPRVVDLYDQVVRRYATQLEALRPVIEIPIRP